LRLLNYLLSFQALRSVQVAAVCTISLFVCAVHAGPSHPNPRERKYVFNVEDNRVHIGVHRENVLKLALKLYEKYPGLFPFLSLEQVAIYFEGHDEEKTLTEKDIARLVAVYGLEEKLKEFGFEDIKDFASSSIEFHGIDISRLEKGSPRHTELSHIIDFTNLLGRYLKEERLERIGLSRRDTNHIHIINALEDAEIIIDLTETYKNKVRHEEFGQEPRSAIRYFPRYISIIVWLEDNYKTFVEAHPLIQRYQQRLSVVKAPIHAPLECSKLFAP
jgi:hypothetical protein